MIHHWKGRDLEITDVDYHHGRTLPRETIPSQTLSFRLVEIIKLSDERTYNTSFGSA